MELVLLESWKNIYSYCIYFISQIIIFFADPLQRLTSVNIKQPPIPNCCHRRRWWHPSHRNDGGQGSCFSEVGRRQRARAARSGPQVQKRNNDEENVACGRSDTRHAIGAIWATIWATLSFDLGQWTELGLVLRDLAVDLATPAFCSRARCCPLLWCCSDGRWLAAWGPASFADKRGGPGVPLIPRRRPTYHLVDQAWSGKFWKTPSANFHGRLMPGDCLIGFNSVVRTCIFSGRLVS
jgi:hypothetical protein